MRPTFFEQLFLHMKQNINIFALTGDLGYGGFDRIRLTFPDRFINCGAAEQSLLDVAVGLAMSGKIPVVYSITPFLIYRPFETLRTYINHEKWNVKLIGSGRDKDYSHDGFSHDASDVKLFLGLLPNIEEYYPETKDEIPSLVDTVLKSDKPCFISLKR